MRRGLLMIVLCTLSVAMVWAQQPITDPPEIEGIDLVATVGNVCPREVPTQVDTNGDGVDDFLCPSYHDGPLKDYMPMEKAQAGLGLIESVSREPRAKFLVSTVFEIAENPKFLIRRALLKPGICARAVIGHDSGILHEAHVSRRDIER